MDRKPPRRYPVTRIVRDYAAEDNFSVWEAGSSFPSRVVVLSVKVFTVGRFTLGPRSSFLLAALGHLLLDPFPLVLDEPMQRHFEQLAPRPVRVFHPRSHFGGDCLARSRLVFEVERPFEWGGRDGRAQLEVTEVGRERVEAVKDVSRVQDRGVPFAGLFNEEIEQAGTDQHVQVDRHLVEKEHVPRRHESTDDLDAPAFTVRDFVHVPLEIDVENIEEAIPSLLVAVTADRVQEMRYFEIASDDGVGGPFGAEVGDSGWGLEEDVLAEDLGVTASETFPCEDLEQSRFACSVRAYEQAP